MDSIGKIEYQLIYLPGWNEHFAHMDKSVQDAILKKIEKQRYETQIRHLKKGTEFSVLEIGQYRVALKINEKEKIKTIEFAGNHKQYEKWYTQNIGFRDEGVNDFGNQNYLRFISLFSKKKPIPAQ